MEHRLTPLQAKLLESLKWFNHFCRENNLRYYAIGGTILGAMRHEGFIPWDDDIDLGMPRKDYEKLRQLSKQVKGRFRIESYDSDADDFCYPFTKIYDTTTTLVEPKKIKVVRGVFIDVFPLDGIGNTEEEALCNYKRVKRLSQFFETMNVTTRKGRSWIKNLAVIACRLIPKFLVNQKSLRIKLNECCQKYDFDQCKLGGNLLGTYWEREIIDLSLLGTPTYYPFEDTMIAGPEFADKYLTQIYRNWRALPPKEKQVTHHDFIYLDLEKSYLER